MKNQQAGRAWRVDVAGATGKNILLLDQWSNGNELPQTLTQTLRELIFNALSNYIDWDGELMGERFFRGNTGLFRQAGVNFRNQSTQLGAPGKVQLIIPLEGDSLAETAFVLQGLLKYQYYGNWNYPEGPTCLRLFAGCLEKWANHLLKQLRSPLKSGEQWDPVPAVVELLALGNGAAGLPTLRGEPVAQASAILQQPPETGHEQRSTAWKSLIGEYISYHNALKDILLTRISCTKGGSSNVKVIDAAAVLHTLQGTETGNWLTARPPGDLRSEYNALEKMQQKFLNRLDNAMEEEKRHCLRWLKKMHDHLGNPINRQGLANRILQAMEEAQQAGVFRQPGRIGKSSMAIQHGSVRPVPVRCKRAKAAGKQNFCLNWALLTKYHGDCRAFCGSCQPFPYQYGNPGKIRY